MNDKLDGKSGKELEKWRQFEAAYEGNASKDRRDRMYVAARNVLFDQGFLSQVGEGRRAIKGIIEKVCKGAYEFSPISCDQVDGLIRDEIPKKAKGVDGTKGGARRSVVNYKRKMGEWVDGETPFEYPPNFELQKMPPLTDEALPLYLSSFEKAHGRFLGGGVYSIIMRAQERLKEIGVSTFDDEVMDNPAVADLMQERDVLLRSEKQKIGLTYPYVNLKGLLVEYVGKGQDKALKVLLHILTLDEKRVNAYDSILIAILEKLKDNEFFVRALFNLVDEVFNRRTENSPAVTSIILTYVLNAASKMGLCQVDPKGLPLVHDWSSPRDFHEYLVYVFGENGEVVDHVVYRTPVRYVPVSWNSHRIVNPLKNEQFQDFTGRLGGFEVDDITEEGEIDKYEDGLMNRRKFSTNFSRMVVTGVPGFSDKDELSFHFFKREGGDPKDLGVEVVFNGASVVYHMNGECGLEMRSMGNVFPSEGVPIVDPVLKEVLDKVPALYDFPGVRDWLSPENLEKLRYFVLKYAYYLLVERSASKTKSGSGRSGGPTPFDIKLTEHETSVEMPYGKSDVDGEGRSLMGGVRRIVVRHDVDGFVRPLPEGQRHSAEAAERARESGIDVLLPGQTFVKGHSRGSQFAENRDPDKKVTK